MGFVCVSNFFWFGWLLLSFFGGWSIFNAFLSFGLFFLCSFFSFIDISVRMVLWQFPLLIYLIDASQFCVITWIYHLEHNQLLIIVTYWVFELLLLLLLIKIIIIIVIILIKINLVLLMLIIMKKLFNWNLLKFVFISNHMNNFPNFLFRTCLDIYITWQLWIIYYYYYYYYWYYY